MRRDREARLEHAAGLGARLVCAALDALTLAGAVIGAVRVAAPVARREALWAVHNLVAHPLSEITHWLGYAVPALRRAGLWLHDHTVPPHEPGTGRG